MVYSGYDWLFIPSVFNTPDAAWINGLHNLWIKAHKDKINWDIVVPEAYIILNPKCAAARITKAKPMIKEDVVAAAIVAERFFKFPVVYVEYSGIYGDPEIVKAVSENLKSAKLIYGGGIKTQEQAAEMSQYATIVVGNTIYDEGRYGDDCEDEAVDINPGQTEICLNGIDDNCNGEIDEGCIVCSDMDQDSFDDCPIDEPNGDGKQIDCDDYNNSIYPGAVFDFNTKDYSLRGVIQKRANFISHEIEPGSVKVDIRPVEVVATFIRVDDKALDKIKVGDCQKDKGY